MAEKTELITPDPAWVASFTEKHRKLRPYYRFITNRWSPHTCEGAEHVPRVGPVLLLANHTCFFDAPIIPLFAERPVITMTTESLLQGRHGAFLMSLGVVPKKKFVSDSRAVRLLKGWADAGAAIGMFPEGQRTWDGLPLPLLPGVEKLVRLLGIPVITARIYNGDRVWPRWAAVPRRGRLHVVFDPPRSWDKKTPMPQVRAEIERALYVDPLTCPRWPMGGPITARGVSNLLFACPSCLTLEALVESARAVSCTSCGLRWKVTAENRLVRPGSEETLLTAVQRIRQHVIAAGWRDPGGAGEVHLRSQPVRILDQTGDAPVVLGEGSLELTSEGLRLQGGAWSLPFAEMATISCENRRRLWLRTKDRLIEPVFPVESVYKWEWIGGHWLNAWHEQHGTHVATEHAG